MNSVFEFLRISGSKGDKTPTVKGDLHGLCRKGDVDAVKLMLNSGTAGNVDSRMGNLGLTPLHEACSHNHPVVCQWLLRYGVEVGLGASEESFLGLDFIRQERRIDSIADRIALLQRSESKWP